MMRPRGKRGTSVWRSVVPIILLSILGLGILFSIQVYGVQSKITEMFRLNRELQEQNYYMAEFEYRLLGISYLMDKGHYRKSLDLLNQYYHQLKSREGLIKLPEFASLEEELRFYLNQQNPETGAFMDSAYPLCVYHGPTENVINHLEILAQRINKPLKLKYRLRYLDQINTPEKLTAFLNDVSTVGYIASKLPQTSFHTARDILSLARDDRHPNAQYIDNTIEKYEFYHFSSEWEKTMLQWFYDAQDPKTGLWGPKSKSGQLRKRDLQNTSSILKIFKDRNGNNIYTEFPLRYADALLTSTCAILSEQPPKDDDLAWVHEWNLQSLKGLRLITRYLWKEVSSPKREMVATLFKKHIRSNCEKYYIPAEGAFSYYPNSKHATMDGATIFFFFSEIGALSSQKQQYLWGSFEETIQKDITIGVSQLTEAKLQSIARTHAINSFRFYQDTPDHNCLFSGVRFIYYPKSTPVPDIMELTRGMKQFLATTNLEMGNWVSKEEVSERLTSIVIPEGISIIDNIPKVVAQDILTKNGELYIIGFDLLQIPRCKIVVKRKDLSRVTYNVTLPH